MHLAMRHRSRPCTILRTGIAVRLPVRLSPSKAVHITILDGNDIFREADGFTRSMKATPGELLERRRDAARIPQMLNHFESGTGHYRHRPALRTSGIRCQIVPWMR